MTLTGCIVNLCSTARGGTDAHSPARGISRYTRIFTHRPSEARIRRSCPDRFTGYLFIVWSKRRDVRAQISRRHRKQVQNRAKRGQRQERRYSFVPVRQAGATPSAQAGEPLNADNQPGSFPACFGRLQVMQHVHEGAFHHAIRSARILKTMKQCANRVWVHGKGGGS